MAQSACYQVCQPEFKPLTHLWGEISSSHKLCSDFHMYLPMHRQGNVKKNLSEKLYNFLRPVLNDCKTIYGYRCELF